jgi:hypothetical protein
MISDIGKELEGVMMPAEFEETAHLVSSGEVKAAETVLSINGGGVKDTSAQALHHLKHNRRMTLRYLHSFMRQQIFTGMAASSVPVRPEIPNLKEDLDCASIRFVYFSRKCLLFR